MTKQEARERMKVLRRELSGTERDEKSRAAANHLFQLPAMKQASYFFPFVSYGTEIDTRGIIEQVLAEGRLKTAVPKVEGTEMEFYQITAMEQLKPGYQGILEPDTGQRMPAEEGVMLLPGLAFDREKNRVGYGGGFYDRYLQKHCSKIIVTIALAYGFQIIDRIEAQDFDQKPQWIVTENGVF